MNRIYIYFLFFHLVLILGFLKLSDQVADNSNYSYSFFYAPIYFGTCLLASYIGIIFAKNFFKEKQPNNSQVQYYIQPVFIYLGYLLSLISVIVCFLYILKSGLTIREYYLKIFIEEATDLYEGGNKRIISGGDSGGLKGIIKMFNVGCVAVYLFTFSFLTYSKDSPQQNKIVSLRNFSILCIFLRTLLLLDRLYILPFLISFFFIALEKKKIFTKSNLIKLFVVALFFNFITMQRGYGNIISGISNYLYSHVNNLEIIMNSKYAGFNYWGRNSIFPAFYDVVYADIFHVNIPLINYAYGDNPAQNFLAFVYMDFYWVGLLIYFFIGFFLVIFEYKFRHSDNFFYKPIYFLFLFDCISLIIVPAHTGIEFWLVFIIIFIYSFFIKTKTLQNNLPV